MNNIVVFTKSDKEMCTGCGVCAEKCPKGCIKMQEDDEGFFYPAVDENDCTHCGKCMKSCHSHARLQASDDYIRKAYRTFSLAENTRYNSTSGGLFTELASVVLNKNGCVYGAAYDYSRKTVVHQMIDDISKLHLLRQSKYVQSNMETVLKSLKEEDDKGRLILFCGTPCQMAAVCMFFETIPDNLILIDFACMGAASPKAFYYWLKEMEERMGCKVTNCWFKYKDRGWKNSPLTTRLDFEDGKWTVMRGHENYYMRGYVEDLLFMRPSCSQCVYKGTNKYSDITIGDFWGLKEPIDDTMGVSFCIVNSKKGEWLFDKARKNLDSRSISVQEACSNNAGMTDYVERNGRAHEFLVNLGSNSFSELYMRFAMR